MAASRAAWTAALAVLVAGQIDARVDAGSLRPRSDPAGELASLPDALYYELRSAAFPGSGRPDVAVHVPPGFDAARRPGLVLYFHGWNGCVEASLSSEETTCSDEGDPRPGSALAAQLDDARVNALLVAVELRADMATGEPGALAMPGGARALLTELFTEHLARPLGRTLELDAFDRIVLVSHSGGYQATASVLRYGDLPNVREIDLLDSLYGADDVFAAWLHDAVVPSAAPRRFVDVYTEGGGTADRSRAMAALARSWRSWRSWESRASILDDDEETELDPASLARSIVFKRVARAHGDLPRAYFEALLESSGFTRIEVDDDGEGDREQSRFIPSAELHSGDEGRDYSHVRLLSRGVGASD